VKKNVTIVLSCILLGICLITLLNVLLPQKSEVSIHVHVNNSTQKEITVRLPVKGANFGANRKTIRLNDKNECEIVIPNEDCGLTMINHDFGHTRLITFPGDKIDLNITAKNDISYKGDNAAGHKFFNSLERQLIQDVNNPYKKDTLASIIEQKINDKKNDELARLGQLLKANSIDKAYSDFARRDIQYYYAASMADAMASKYYSHLKSGSLFKEDYATAWKQSFRQMPLDSPDAITTENFKYYAGLYYEWFVGDFLGERKSSGIKGIHRSNYHLIDEHFKGDVAEYLKAFYIYVHVLQKTHEQSLVDIYQQFTCQYPNSNYIPFIKGDIDSIIAFNHAIGKDTDSGFTILTGYDQLNSMRELLHSLKGSVYYVDIWSTWCVPCQEEFAYTPGLQSLLTGRNIKILYLSIDNDQADKRWKELIKYYKLPGLHARTNKLLYKDLFRLLAENHELAIPRYLLIDKNGTIVNNNAERPSDTGKLHLQISSLPL